jgi:hypothetical protein
VVQATHQAKNSIQQPPIAIFSPFNHRCHVPTPTPSIGNTQTSFSSF